jgi:hypothetical protein
MKKIMLLVLITTLAVFARLNAQYKYACFENKANKKLALTAYFKKDKAVLIRYKGQKKAIPLIYSTTEQTANNNGSPPFFWKETYFVKAGKKIVGSYVFTNAGAYELQLSYMDKRSNRKNDFVIIPSLAAEDFSPYRNVPCF